MLTEILIQETGSFIDYDVKAVNHERGEIKKNMSQVDYNTNRANTKKASREGIIKELKAAKEELLKSAQDEHKKETTGDPNMDKVRNDTAAQILHLIGKDTLPTPRAGTRENPDELDIYENRSSRSRTRTNGHKDKRQYNHSLKKLETN